MSEESYKKENKEKKIISDEWKGITKSVRLPFEDIKRNIDNFNKRLSETTASITKYQAEKEAQSFIQTDLLDDIANRIHVQSKENKKLLWMTFFILLFTLSILILTIFS